MLTGDNDVTANVVARHLNIDEVYANLLPEDKGKIIEKYKSLGHVVAMIGDGINDAPALALADVGIAMGAAGTDVAIESSDITLMADSLRKVVYSIGLSKATLRNIKQNVTFALIVCSPWF
jgi:Cd2+/Zn2+-exporting ATPase